MAYIRHENELNMDQVAAFLQDAVSTVKARPDEYEELIKVFKKNVPLMLRKYVSAYLLKQAGGARLFSQKPSYSGSAGRAPRYAAREFRHSRYEKPEQTTETPSFERHEPRPRVQIDPDSAVTVFVGIGRNRRTFPRDIVGLFTNVGGVERERIGDIRVLASYSFVQLFKEDADKAISALNGYSYRGRPLSVSYSRQRDNAEADEAEEPIPSSVSNESSGIRDSYSAATSDTIAEQTAFAKAQSQMTDEEILAARAPRSSSTDDVQ